MINAMKNEEKKEVEIVREFFPLVKILVLMFVAAKLVGCIDWSWWWVFSPIWISFIVKTVILIGVVVIAWIISNVE